MTTLRSPIEWTTAFWKDVSVSWRLSDRGLLTIFNNSSTEPFMSSMSIIELRFVQRHPLAVDRRWNLLVKRGTSQLSRSRLAEKGPPRLSELSISSHDHIPSYSLPVFKDSFMIHDVDVDDLRVVPDLGPVSYCGVIEDVMKFVMLFDGSRLRRVRGVDKTHRGHHICSSRVPQRIFIPLLIPQELCRVVWAVWLKMEIK